MASDVAARSIGNIGGGDDRTAGPRPEIVRRAISGGDGPRRSRLSPVRQPGQVAGGVAVRRRRSHQRTADQSADEHDRADDAPRRAAAESRRSRPARARRGALVGAARRARRSCSPDALPVRAGRSPGRRRRSSPYRSADRRPALLAGARAGRPPVGPVVPELPPAARRPTSPVRTAAVERSAVGGGLRRRRRRRATRRPRRTTSTAATGRCRSASPRRRRRAPSSCTRTRASTSIRSSPRANGSRPSTAGRRVCRGTRPASLRGRRRRARTPRCPGRRSRTSPGSRPRAAAPAVR